MARAKGYIPSSCQELIASKRWRSKVEAASDGCLLWSAAVSQDGYGIVYLDGRARYAHRVALVAYLGRDITVGMDAGHTCHDAALTAGECAGGTTCVHRRCVNPDHLTEQSYQANTLLGNSLQAQNAAKTHCPRGHELVDGNLVLSQLPSRSCLICANEHGKRHYSVISEAVRVLGITHTEYRSVYGSSSRVAEEIVRANA